MGVFPRLVILSLSLAVLGGALWLYAAVFGVSWTVTSGGLGPFEAGAGRAEVAAAIASGDFARVSVGGCGQGVDDDAARRVPDCATSVTAVRPPHWQPLGEGGGIEAFRIEFSGDRVSLIRYMRDFGAF